MYIEATGRALVKFLGWAIHDGQKYAPDLLCALLPEAVVKLVETRIREIPRTVRCRFLRPDDRCQ